MADVDEFDLEAAIADWQSDPPEPDYTYLLNAEIEEEP
jgi:hypothetical protein